MSSPVPTLSLRHRLLLGAVVVLALAARLPHMERDSLWMDELFSMAQSGGYPAWIPLPPANRVISPPARPTSLAEARPWPHVVTELAVDNHPPLHFLLLRGWREAFGDGTAAVRSLSVLFSIASLLLLFDAVRHLDGVPGALWATLLGALAGPHVYYAREARSYSLLVFFLLGAAAAAARLQARGPGAMRAVCLGACVLSACLSHYGGVGFLFGLFAWVALARFERGGRREAIAAFVGAGLVFLVLWGPMLWKQRLAFGPNNAWNVDDPNDVQTPSTRLLPLPLQVVFTSGPFFARRPATLGVAWLALAWLAWRRREVRLWAATALGAIAYAAMVDAFWGSAQLAFSRYVLPATPAVCALLAGARLGNGWRRAAVPALAALGLAAVLPAVWAPHRPPWGEWGDKAGRLVPSGEVIALWQPRILRKGTLLLVQHYAWAPDRRLMLLEPPLDDEARRALGRRFWLVTSQASDPGAAVPGARLTERLRLPESPRVYEARLDPP